MRRLLLASVLLLGTGLLGCDTTATQPETEVVVEAYVEEGAPLPPIRLTRTVSADETYDPVENAVRGADVAVDALDSDETVTYTEDPSTPGRYVPTSALPAEAQSTYRLRATTDDGTEVTATTTVPGPIEIVDTEALTAVYQGPAQPTFTVELGEASTQRQNVLTFTTTALRNFGTTPDSVLSRYLTPFYADDYTPAEDDLEQFRITSSGLLNEANFDRTDGTISVRLPWIAVAFYGPNEAAINVVDDNYYDFLRSQQVQQGGLEPGAIPNVIEHVEGGTGLFGSYARVSAQVAIQCSEEVPGIENCPEE